VNDRHDKIEAHR